MWHKNKQVVYIYGHVNTRYAFAIIGGLSGWKRVAPVSDDGVSNVLDILNIAKANGRRVNVDVDSGNQILAAVML